MRPATSTESRGPRFDPVAVRAFTVVPVALSVLVLAWSLWNLDRMPDPMTTYIWPGSEPDSTGSPLTFILVVFVLSLGSSLLSLMCATTKTPAAFRRVNSSVFVALSFMLVGVSFTTVQMQLDRDVAGLSGISLVYVSLFVVIGYGWAEFVGRHLAEYPSPVADAAPPSSAPRGPVSSPSTVTGSRGMWIIGLCLVLTVLGGLRLFLPLGFLLLVFVCEIFQLSFRSTVSVNDSAVLVRTGVIRPATLMIELTSVKSAQPKKLSAMDVGGVGIRSDNNGGTVVAPRTGHAVVLDTTVQRWTLAVADTEAAQAISGDVNSRCDRAAATSPASQR